VSGIPKGAMAENNWLKSNRYMILPDEFVIDKAGDQKKSGQPKLPRCVLCIEKSLRW
jgi:hypothetical protein